MDIFTWSVPFVAEKVVEMLYNVLKLSNDMPDEVIVNDEEYQKAILQEEEKNSEKLKSKQIIFNNTNIYHNYNNNRG